MDSMEYRLSKFKNDIANQFGHNVFYNNVLIRVFYYLLEKRINTRILFLMTTYRRVLFHTNAEIVGPKWASTILQINQLKKYSNFLNVNFLNLFNGRKKCKNVSTDLDTECQLNEGQL